LMRGKKVDNGDCFFKTIESLHMQLNNRLKRQ